jgi:hypothetical protein
MKSLLGGVPDGNQHVIKIKTLMLNTIFHFKFNNVKIMNPNLDML